MPASLCCCGGASSCAPSLAGGPCPSARRGGANARRCARAASAARPAALRARRRAGCLALAAPAGVHRRGCALPRRGRPGPPRPAPLAAPPPPSPSCRPGSTAPAGASGRYVIAAAPPPRARGAADAARGARCGRPSSALAAAPGASCRTPARPAGGAARRLTRCWPARGALPPRRRDGGQPRCRRLERAAWLARCCGASVPALRRLRSSRSGWARSRGPLAADAVRAVARRRPAAPCRHRPALAAGIVRDRRLGPPRRPLRRCAPRSPPLPDRPRLLTARWRARRGPCRGRRARDERRAVRCRAAPAPSRRSLPTAGWRVPGGRRPTRAREPRPVAGRRCGRRPSRAACRRRRPARPLLGSPRAWARCVAEHRRAAARRHARAARPGPSASALATQACRRAAGVLRARRRAAPGRPHRRQRSAALSAAAIAEDRRRPPRRCAGALVGGRGWAPAARCSAPAAWCCWPAAPPTPPPPDRTPVDPDAPCALLAVSGERALLERRRTSGCSAAPRAGPGWCRCGREHAAAPSPPGHRRQTPRCAPRCLGRRRGTRQRAARGVPPAPTAAARAGRPGRAPSSAAAAAHTAGPHSRPPAPSSCRGCWPPVAR